MRVIAGEFRGHTLRAPRGTRTRPTTDRVREALFSILGDVAGCRVLDLFAGTGALGIEALSRGAERAVFVESWSQAALTLRGNLTALGVLDRSEVIQLPLERATNALIASAPFDLVLCDPPWSELVHSLTPLPRLVEAGVMADGARLVVEHRAGEPFFYPDDHGLRVQQSRSWGDTGATFFVYDRTSDTDTPPTGLRRAL